MPRIDLEAPENEHVRARTAKTQMAGTLTYPQPIARNLGPPTRPTLRPPHTSHELHTATRRLGSFDGPAVLPARGGAKGQITCGAPGLWPGSGGSSSRTHLACLGALTPAAMRWHSISSRPRVRCSISVEPTSQKMTSVYASMTQPHIHLRGL